MSERTPRFLWMEVSKALGLKDENSVISSVSRAKRGGYWCKYKRVPYLKE